MNPLVSICIPTFNGQKFIAEAMDSALQQTYSNLEIIISDDASSDNTLELIKSYINRTDIPIKIINHTPRGIGANWNNCVRNSNGEYIKFLLQDDVLYPTCIEEMVLTAEKDENIGLIFSKRQFLFETLNEKTKSFIECYANLHRYWYDFDVVEGVYSGKVFLRDKEFLNAPKNKIGEPSNVLLKTECFKKVGYFNEIMQQALDSDFWYRVMPYYNIAFIDKELSAFRLHQDQASVRNKSRDIPDKDLMYQEYYRHLFKYLNFKNQIKLFKLFHPLGKRLFKIKRALNII